MRERAHLAGGWLTAGPDGEHFRVTAFIPFGARDATPGEEPAGSAAGGTFGDTAAPGARPALAAAGVALPAAPASEASGQEADDRA